MKIDQNFGSNHHLASSITRRATIRTRGRPGLRVCRSRCGTDRCPITALRLYRLSYDWTISPRMFNHFSIGGNQFFKNSYSPNSGGNWKGKVCIPNAVDCNVNFPNISFSEFTGWGSTAYNGTEQPLVAQGRSELHPRRAHLEIRLRV